MQHETVNTLCCRKSGFSPLVGEQARCEKFSTIADVTKLRGCNCAHFAGKLPDLIRAANSRLPPPHKYTRSAPLLKIKQRIELM